MQSISNDDLSIRLMVDNPWWDYSSGFESKLRTQRKRDLFPAFFRSIQDLGQGTGLVLAGTLGVGKTVMLRQAVARGAAVRGILRLSGLAGLWVGGFNPFVGNFYVSARPWTGNRALFIF